MALILPAVASADIVQTITGWGTQTIISSSGASTWLGNSTIVAPPPSGFGNPGYVTFDEYANGTPATSFTYSGVQFSLVGAGSATSTLVAKSAGSVIGNLQFGDDSISKYNTLAAFDGTYPNYNGVAPTVRITFTPDTSQKQLLPQNVGLDFVDAPPNDVFTVRAYNAQGTLVATVTSDTADNLYNTTPAPTPTSDTQLEDHFMGYSYGGGIAYVEYTMALNHNGNVYGNEIDNVYFDVPVAPEPATLALLGLGSLVLTRMRSRQRRGQ